MDEILKQSLLYDFYGELLTEHQKEIYEQFIVEDLSLSEIAKDAGISRQGVHDLVKRCDKILEEYEAKLHLVEKFLSIKEKVHQINELLKDAKTDESQLIQDIRKISGEIIEEL
ncbi:MAG: YlxM family DNA-binding protein [Tyzzerella sp.]|nr:YlxM family DNA-binding protein [Tyzzerella sp.]